MRTKIAGLSQRQIDMMSEDDRKALNLKSSEDVTKKLEAKNEAEIQKQVEAYLIQLGYERRTPEDIGRGMSRSGYQIHLYATKRNPILLDLLILSHSGRYLELELKTATGKLRPEQKALIAYGGCLARSAEEAIEIIRKWHESL
jgi:hypothetical protein